MDSMMVDLLAAWNVSFVANMLIVSDAFGRLQHVTNERFRGNVKS
jgi:hypothetical protein